jgi:hypothetical protein
MNVSILDQIPGILLTASGRDSHRSGLSYSRSDPTNMANGNHVLEFESIATPQQLASVYSKNGDYDHLALLDTETLALLFITSLGQWKDTYWIPSHTFPFLSVKGLFSGRTSSFIASRNVAGTGACTRSVSRTTWSR